MSQPDEELMEEIDDDEDSESLYLSTSMEFYKKRRKEARRRNKILIEGFLGTERRTNAVVLMPSYYDELLTWALHQHLKRDGWEIIETLGDDTPTPGYVDVNTGHPDGTREHLLAYGQMLVKKDDYRLLVSVDLYPRHGVRASVQLLGASSLSEEMDRFVQAVKAIAREENFYRWKTLEYSGSLEIVDVRSRSWDSVVLEESLKREVRANTTEFLKGKDVWSRYGIPLKRGVILAGEPGTGKTVVCKAIISEAEGITCIIAGAYDMDCKYYITKLYEIANDLRPSIVFLEDIDVIAESRTEFDHYHQPSLTSLLAALDGIEERDEVITVATTNCLEALDRALSQRPSRFDRVIQVSCPSLHLRQTMLDSLCQRIPLDHPTQEYIAEKTNDCTPAQLQEIVYSLAIDRFTGMDSDAVLNLEFSVDEIDRAIARVKGKNGNAIGFILNRNGNGAKNRTTDADAINQSHTPGGEK